LRASRAYFRRERRRVGELCVTVTESRRETYVDGELRSLSATLTTEIETSLSRTQEIGVARRVGETRPTPGRRATRHSDLLVASEEMRYSASSSLARVGRVVGDIVDLADRCDQAMVAAEKMIGS
jgi:hypothetical protein